MTDTKQSQDSHDSTEAAAAEKKANANAEAEAPKTADDAAESASSAEEPSHNPATAAKKAEEYYARLVRTMADFDNFKKRAARERMDTARYACSSLMERLLPILDNLEMAMSATEKAQDQSMESLKTGVGMVLQQFKAALKESGMEEIDAAGQAFDPNVHEAVSQQETDQVPEGHIAMQLRRGYKLYDRLLRPASVVVAKAPSDTPGPESEDTGSDSAPKSE